jgi:voltage-gated potassium channel
VTRARFLKRLGFVVAVVVMLLAAGTAAFLQLGWNFSDAFYMTVITLSAVGYQEVRPLTQAGRVLVGFLLVGGVTAMGLWFALITAALVEFDLSDVFSFRRTMQRLKEMSDHVVVCGAGRTGLQVVRELVAADVPYVVVERDGDRADRIREIDPEAPVLKEDATRDETLEEARIPSARALVTALSADTDNVFVCLSAREMNPEMNIVARAVDEDAAGKLRQAGADHCVSPNVIGGSRMASMLLRPQVMDFLDVVTGVGDVPLRLEEVEVPDGSSLAEHSLAEAAIPQKTGLIVIAISHREAQDEGRLVYNPGPDERIRPGDALIVLGQQDQVDGLRAIVSP